VRIAADPLRAVVVLAFADGHKEFVQDTHLHGYRDGQLQLAAGPPGAGPDVEVVRTVPVADLVFAETASRDEHADDGGSSGPAWRMGWQ
jgi:hypothetical protein